MYLLTQMRIEKAKYQKQITCVVWRTSRDLNVYFLFLCIYNRGVCVTTISSFKSLTRLDSVQRNISHYIIDFRLYCSIVGVVGTDLLIVDKFASV